MKLSFPAGLSQYIGLNSSMAYSIADNVVADIPFSQSKTSNIGFSTFPGFEKIVDSNLSVYADCMHNGEFYFIFQDTLPVSTRGLAKLDSSFNLTVVGSISKYVGSDFSMVSNGESICILQNGVAGWFYDEDSGINEITDPFFLDRMSQDGGVRSLEFIDGYFLFCTYDSIFSTLLVSVNKGQDFDATYILRPFLTEKAIKVLEARGELIVFGENQAKTYSNQGGSDFPWVEIPGATINKGVASEKGAISFDGSYFFVGSGKNEDVSIYRGVGGGGVSKISTDYQDRILNQKDVTFFGQEVNPVISAFQIDGKSYVSVDYFTGSDSTSITLIYDILASSVFGMPWWCRFSPGEFSAYNSYFTEAFDSTIVYSTSGFYRLSNNVYGFFSYDGSGRPSFTGQYLQAQSDPMIINRLELVMESGAGAEMASNPETLNPTVLLEFSDDGAKTWNSAGSQSVGRFGQYKNRLVWPMLGLAPQSRIFRFTADTKVPLRFHRIDMEVEKGFLYG